MGRVTIKDEEALLSIGLLPGLQFKNPREPIKCDFTVHPPIIRTQKPISTNCCECQPPQVYRNCHIRHFAHIVFPPPHQDFLSLENCSWTDGTSIGANRSQDRDSLFVQEALLVLMLNVAVLANHVTYIM